MAVARRPKRQPQASDETQIAALIDKGGTAVGHTAQAPTQNLAVALRIPGPLAERLARALEDNMTRMPRHTWILEAIVESWTGKPEERKSTLEGQFSAPREEVWHPTGEARMRGWEALSRTVEVSLIKKGGGKAWSRNTLPARSSCEIQAYSMTDGSDPVERRGDEGTTRSRVKMHDKER